MRRFIDLSHPIREGMETYPGLPAPRISDFLSREASRGKYAEGVEFQIGRIDMVANTGTYVDAPFHRWEGRADLARLPLESLADLEGVMIEAPKGRAITAAVFDGADVKGRAVLVRTGFDRHWGTKAYFEGNPFLTADAAMRLREAGAALVGIDSLNIDDTADPARPAHSILLEAGIPIVEHMRGLGSLPRTGFRFFAVPPPIESFGSFPVRAFAIVG